MRRDDGDDGVNPFSAPAVARAASSVSAIRASLRLLPRRDIRLFGLALVAQILLGLLDLLAIAAAGVIGAIAVSGIESVSLPSWLSPLVARIGLSSVQPIQLAAMIGGAAVAAMLLKTILSALLTRRLLMFLAVRRASITVSLSQRLLGLPLLEVQRWSSQETFYALMAGVAASISVISQASMLIAEGIFISLTVVLLLIADPPLTLAMLALFGLAAWIMQRLLGTVTASNSKRQASMRINSMTAVQEALLTYRESTVMDRRHHYIARVRGVTLSEATFDALNGFLFEIPKYVLEVTLVIAATTLAVIQYTTKDLSAAVGITALFLVAGWRIVPSVLRFQGALLGIRNNAAFAAPTYALAERLHAATGSTGEISPASSVRARSMAGSSDHSALIASIAVDDAWVTYPSASRPALAGVSFTSPHGSAVALAGSTGAGKSTLADLLLGILEPDSGVVLLGGRKPRDAISSWPGGIGYVPQDTIIVQGTVRSNVALGLPDELIDDGLIWEALERARLDSFLRNTRQGLDTVVGERGVRLSGGQRQRLGIARALYTRPRFVVFDEATSALDSETEALITHSLAELSGDVTTVTIAHRLATVRNADLVLFLEHGHLIAEGTFAEVRAAAPTFDRQARLLGL